MPNPRPRTLATTLLLTPLLLIASSQDYRDGHRVPDNYYSGVRDGGRGGNYDRGPRDNYRPGYDDRNHQPGGVGPGKGAAIGAVGGAALGVLFGGGLKGAVIGGAAGAGVGAIAGQANQNNRRDNY
jgi:hypothetical protein